MTYRERFPGPRHAYMNVEQLTDEMQKLDLGPNVHSITNQMRNLAIGPRGDPSPAKKHIGSEVGKSLAKLPDDLRREIGGYLDTPTDFDTHYLKQGLMNGTSSYNTAYNQLYDKSQEDRYRDYLTGHVVETLHHQKTMKKLRREKYKKR